MRYAEYPQYETIFPNSEIVDTRAALKRDIEIAYGVGVALQTRSGDVFDHEMSVFELWSSRSIDSLAARLACLMGRHARRLDDGTYETIESFIDHHGIGLSRMSDLSPDGQSIFIDIARNA